MTTGHWAARRGGGDAELDDAAVEAGWRAVEVRWRAVELSDRAAQLEEWDGAFMQGGGRCMQRHIVLVIRDGGAVAAGGG